MRRNLERFGVGIVAALAIALAAASDLASVAENFDLQRAFLVLLALTGLLVGIGTSLVVERLQDSEGNLLREVSKVKSSLTTAERKLSLTEEEVRKTRDAVRREAALKVHSFAGTRLQLSLYREVDGAVQRLAASHPIGWRVALEDVVEGGWFVQPVSSDIRTESDLGGGKWEPAQFQALPRDLGIPNLTAAELIKPANNHPSLMLRAHLRVCCPHHVSAKDTHAIARAVIDSIMSEPVIRDLDDVYECRKDLAA